MKTYKFYGGNMSDEEREIAEPLDEIQYALSQFEKPQSYVRVTIRGQDVYVYEPMTRDFDPSTSYTVDETKCGTCWKIDGTVEMRVDPYQRAVNDTHKEELMCSDCYENKLGDI